MPKIIKRGQESQKLVELPPAGYARDEELAKRGDDLAEAAETQSATAERYAVNPKAFEKDRELQYLLEHYNELEVSNADPAYSYCWVQCIHSHGLFVKLKLAERWEVVQGEMQEAIELKGIGADTTRKLGDVMLMRIRKDFFKAIIRRRKANAERHLQSIDAGLIGAGEKYSHLGVKVTTPESGNMNEKTVELMHKRSEAIGKASAMQDKWVREGRMPGMPGPGSRD